MKDYTIIKIDGDYATLRCIDSDDELFIAMALLPIGVDIGTMLRYEDMEFVVL